MGPGSNYPDFLKFGYTLFLIKLELDHNTFFSSPVPTYCAIHIFFTLLVSKFTQLHSRAISAITTSQGFSLSRSPRNSLIRHRKKKNRPFALAGLNWPERAPNVMGRNRVGFLGQLLLLKKLPRLGAEVFPPGATF